jgi:HPt (histidine-containing phosphotransfer) domain-containing protein
MPALLYGGLTMAIPIDRIPERGSRPCHDHAALLQRVGDDPDFLRDLLRLFEVDAAVRLQTMDRGLATHDAVTVAAVAHSLRGMLLIFSAEHAASIAGAIEKRALACDLEDVPPLAARLRAEVDALTMELENGLAASANAGGMR